MTNDKAKELFSEYREGRLDASLRLAFEHKLKSDSELQAEYLAFARVWGGLNQLSQEVVETPSYLRTRIADGIDAVSTQKKSLFHAFGLRQMALSGVAAIALIGAIVAMRGNRGDVSTSSLLPSVGKSKLTLDVELVSNKATVVLDGPGQHTAQILDGKDHRLLKTVTTNEQRLEIPISNLNDSSALFEIAVNSSTPSLIVSVPGRQSSSLSTGKGSLRDFAIALSERYRATVMIEGAAVTGPLAWRFEDLASRAVSTTLAGTGLRGEVRADGVITISVSEATN